MAIKSFLSEGGFSVGSVGSAPIEVIDSSGNITAVGLTVSGNLVVNGSTTTINSTTTTLDDPIFTLGGDTVPTSDDNKDRGIEFRWHNGSLAKVGFFGYDDSTGKFVFIPDATNTSEVFSGTKGTIDANLEWADVLSKPSPVVTVTLTGDVTGTANATLTSLGNGTVTISTTVAADSVALGTDTTGAYVQAINNGSYLTGGNGPSGSESAVLTLAVDATSANTASKVVARDASGNFSAGTITATGGVIASGLTANSWLFEARGTAVYGGFAQYGNNIKSVQYWNASNTISVGSSYSANVANDGDLIVSGKIGVGTLSPGGKLEVNFTAATAATAVILRTSDSGANGAIRWQNSGGTNQAGIGSNFNVSDVGALEFLNGTTTNVIFRSSGSVGIGTTAPQTRLHAYTSTADGTSAGRTTALNVLTLESENTADLEYNGFGQGLVFRGSTYNNSTQRTLGRIVHKINDDSVSTTRGTSIHFETSDNATNTNAPTEKMVINYAGNVGIGRSNPQQKLHLAGTNARIAISNDSDNNWAEIGNDGASGQNTLEFFTGSSSVPAMSITHGNSVGVGTSSPGAKLHVSEASGVGNFAALKLTNTVTSGNANVDIIMEAGGQNGARIRAIAPGASHNDLAVFVSNGGTLQSTPAIYVQGSSNRVGINNTSPSNTLDVTGSVRTTDWYYVDGSGFGMYNNATGLYLSSAGNNWDISSGAAQTWAGLRLYKGGKNVTWLGHFYGDSSGQGFLDSGGNWQLIVDSSSRLRVYAGVYNIEGTTVRVLNPGGAALNDPAAPVTGAFKIKLPVAAYNSNTMMTLVVDIYNYDTGKSLRFRIGGYNYQDGSWYNTFAEQTSDLGVAAYNVRFGNDGTSNCIWIGETNSTWQYPKVFVSQFLGAHAATTSAWASGWTISRVTSFDTVAATRSASVSLNNNNVGAYSVNYLTGTANQVLVNGGSGVNVTGGVTLTLPQNIHTGATPTFSSLTLSGTGTSTFGGPLTISLAQNADTVLRVTNSDSQALARASIQMTGQGNTWGTYVNNTYVRNYTASAADIEWWTSGIKYATLSSTGNLTVSGAGGINVAGNAKFWSLNQSAYYYTPQSGANTGDLDAVNGIRLFKGGTAVLTAGNSTDGNVAVTNNLTVSGTGTSSVAGSFDVTGSIRHVGAGGGIVGIGSSSTVGIINSVGGGGLVIRGRSGTNNDVTISNSDGSVTLLSNLTVSGTGGVQLNSLANLTWGGAYGAGIPTIAIPTATSIGFYPTGSTSGKTFELFGTGAATLTGNLTVNGTGKQTLGQSVNATVYAGNTSTTDQAIILSNTRRANYGDVMIAKNLEGVASADSYATPATTAATGYAAVEMRYGGVVRVYGNSGATTAAAVVAPNVLAEFTPTGIGLNLNTSVTGNLTVSGTAVLGNSNPDLGAYISYGTDVAGWGGIWFRKVTKSAGTMSIGSDTANTVVNAATGGSVFLRVNNSTGLTITNVGGSIDTTIGGNLTVSSGSTTVDSGTSGIVTVGYATALSASNQGNSAIGVVGRNLRASSTNDDLLILKTNAAIGAQGVVFKTGTIELYTVSGSVTAGNVLSSGLAATFTTATSTIAGNLTVSGVGTSTIGGNLTVSGNLIINGTTTTVDSTTLTTKDPIITLGGGSAGTAAASDDNKDRGIEFKWHNGTSAKTGFFGYDDSTGYFTFIPDATNTSEVFSGTKGTIDANLVGNVTGNVSGSAGSLVGTLTAGTYLTGGSFNGSTNVTFAVDATSANTASKVVARDGSGNFTANIITATLSGAATNASSVGSLACGSDFSLGSPGFTNGFTLSSAVTDTDQHGRYYYSGTGSIWTRYLPVDKNGVYRMKIRWKASAAAGTYIAVFLLDTSGNQISGAGTYWAYPWSGASSPTTWTENEYWYNGSSFPSNAAYVAFGISHTNYGGGSATYYVSQLEIQRVQTQISGSTIWTAANDGSGSGLDADLLDGYNQDTANTANTIVRRDGSGNFSASGITASSLSAATITASTFVAGNVGTAIGSSPVVINGTVGDNDSHLIIKKPSQSSLSFLAWDGAAYIGTNTYYENSTWIHNAPAGNTNSNLLVLNPANGVKWYASSNSSASWNVASGVTLWNDSGVWQQPLSNTLTLNTNSGAGLSGSTTYNNSGAATFTVTSNATAANTASTIVFRDSSGNFSAGRIDAASLYDINDTTYYLDPSYYATTSPGLNLAGHLHIGSQAAFDNSAGWSRTILVDGTNHARVRVRASAYASGNNNVNEVYMWVDNSVAAPYGGLYGDYGLKIASGNSSNIALMPANNVGIGTTNPGYKLEVNGSFAATTKSFVIKHPTKEGKKLRYGSLEGPENGVYVRGKLKGSNVIELPDYWTKLVDPESITVQLTPIGSHQKLYVEKIVDNKVYIANENLLAKAINCFFYVLAERCDVEKLEVEIDA